MGPMARQPLHRLWLALVVVAAAVGVAGGLLAGGSDPGATRPPSAAHDPAAVSFTPSGVEAAVVPARTETAPAAGAARHGSGRGLLPLVAALVGLAAALGTRARLVRPPTPGGQPLRARRHAIARRAPPSLQLA